MFFAGIMVSCSDQNQGNETEKQETVTEKPAEEPQQEPEVKGYQVGDIAEDFELKNVDGKMVSLASMTEAKGAVIVFTCNKCPYSVAYEDRLIELDKKYKSEGYPIVAINPNDPEVVAEDGFEEMVKRSEEKGFTFPYLFDEGQKVYPKYGAEKTPHVYVLQKTEEGNKVVYIGAIDDSKDAAEVKEKYLENTIESLLKGEVPSPDFTKAFGCSIKCKKEDKKI